MGGCNCTLSVWGPSYMPFTVSTRYWQISCFRSLSENRCRSLTVRSFIKYPTNNASLILRAVTEMPFTRCDVIANVKCTDNVIKALQRCVSPSSFSRKWRCTLDGFSLCYCYRPSGEGSRGQLVQLRLYTPRSVQRNIQWI